jgi:5-methyltetrahydrofolate--homocysteine methyltransferase
MLFEDLSKYIVEGNNNAADQFTKDALDNGIDPLDIMDNGLIPGMNVVGQKFRDGEYFIPEVLISARAMNSCLKRVRPMSSFQGTGFKGKVVIGTVKGDVHDIGKNIVIMMLEGAGFEVQDLGVDNKPEDFVKAVSENQPEILGLSAMLTTTMEGMKDVISLLKEVELRQLVKVIIGGAPLSADYAQKIGADGYAENGIMAVEKVKDLININ